MREGHEGHPSYDRGYADGRAARSKAVAAYADEIGHEPSVLRTV